MITDTSIETGHVNPGTYEAESCADDIIRREDFHQVVSERYLPEYSAQGNRFCLHSDDQTMKEYMAWLAKLYEQIVASDRVPCRKTSSPDGWPMYEMTALGKRVHLCCKQFMLMEDGREGWVLDYLNHLFNPTITIMLRAMTRWAQTIAFWSDEEVRVPVGSPDDEAARALLRLVRFVRRVSNSWPFKNAWHKHRRREEDNFRSARDTVLRVFEECSRPLVLRIDLYLNQDYRDWRFLEEAKAIYTNYIRSLREGRVVPGYLGYICKREHGISRGLHWHLMVFLDGHDHRNALGLTRLLGEAWKRLGGPGATYFNCYARKDAFIYNGLGLVHTSDEAKIVGIRCALHYMTKRDCVLRTNNAKTQDFRTSRPRKVRTGRLGAPRKNKDSLALVKRLLGGKRSRLPPGYKTVASLERDSSERAPRRARPVLRSND